jgi:malate synthase
MPKKDFFEIKGLITEEGKTKVLTREACEFLHYLHTSFNEKRLKLLDLRKEKQKNFDRGEKPSSPRETAFLRGGLWCAKHPPQDLMDRRVEITGPTDRKMMINALNSRAKVFMADLEDSLSPSWSNIIEGHLNLQRAVERNIDFEAPNGKTYKLEDKIATLVVRPRGWHLSEEHFLIEGEAVSASIFDFGLYLFHNTKKLLENQSGPYFYLPKIETYLEARLWNNIFTASENYLRLPSGTIRATVLIETLQGALSMEEIVYELRDHICGLNAGRWDYIFSFIKNFSNSRDLNFPDRNQITMTVPFMRAYAKKLVEVCHKHNIHAIGGMSAFIPNRNNSDLNKKAIAAVTADKEREASDGFDGTWVAHPDLVSVAKDVFDRFLTTNPHQKSKLPHHKITDSDLLNPKIENASITEEGLRNNISVSLEYIENWLSGLGAVAINNLMEDAATTEISRAQIWQWVRNRAKFSSGKEISQATYQEFKKSEIEKLKTLTQKSYTQSEKILDQIVLSENFVEFFTLPAYKKISETQITN